MVMYVYAKDISIQSLLFPIYASVPASMFVNIFGR